jgi:multidrug resistance efflux pump
MRIVTVVLVLAMFGLALAVVLPGLREIDGRPVDVVRAAPGALSWLVRAEGRIEPAKEADLAFEMAGRIVEIGVDRGDRVEAGQVLAKLESSSLEIELRSAELDLDAAEARLKELTAGARPEEIEEARANIAGAEAVLEQARRDHANAKKLFEQKALDRQSVEHAAMEVTTAESRLEALRKRLGLLEAGARAEERERARIAVAKAGVLVERIRDRLKDTVLRAPFAGQVSLRYLEPGEMAGPDRLVLTLSDTDHLEAVLEVDEYDLAAIRIGLPARITSRSFPDRVFEAPVGEVGLVVGKRRARGEDPTVIYDSRILEVRVPLRGAKGLRSGMTIEGTIEVEKAEAAIVVPLGAIRTRRDGASFVRLAEGDEAWRRVKLGRRDRLDVEVLEGLEEGEAVRLGAHAGEPPAGTRETTGSSR